MKIAIRMDDITPDMDWDKFYRVKEILDDAGIKPLLGIVPDNRDSGLHICENREDFWEQMLGLQQQGWSMALHGMYHIYTTSKGGIFPLNHFSEFAGVPYETQYSMLQAGKAILESHGIVTDLFMAPAHSYDRNTLKALRECGFRALTDGFGEKPYRYSDLTFYPISYRLSRTLQKENGYSTMVLHVNTMDEGDLKAFENRIRNASAVTSFIDFSEYLEVSAEKISIFYRMKEWCMASAKHLLVQLSSLRIHSK